MSWSRLRQRAQQLGFDLAFRSHHHDGGGYHPDLTSPPREEGPWLCVGSYEHVAGVWVQPITESARRLTPEWVSAAIARLDHFVAPIHHYDAEFSADYLAIGLSARHAAQNPDMGRMPA